MGNEQVTIKELLEIQEKFFRGLSEINLEATLKRVLKARNPKGTKEDGQDYNFWAQYLIITDGTGEIGIDITVGKEEETIPTAAIKKRVKVTGAKTDIYQDSKTRKDVRKLTKGKVILLESVDRTPSEKENGGNGKDKVPQEVWQKKDRLIAREAIAKALIVAGRKWNKETETEAIDWYKWVSSGKEEFVNKIEEIESPKSDMLEEEPLATKAQKDKIIKLAAKLGYKTLYKKPIDKVLKTLYKKQAIELIAWLIKEQEIRNIIGEEGEEDKLSNRIDELVKKLQDEVDAGKIDGGIFDDIVTKRFDAKTDEQKEKLVKEIEGILKE